MRLGKGLLMLGLGAIALGLGGCAETASNNANQNTTVTTAVTPPQVQKLSEIARPAKVSEQMAQRGAQDEAQPSLKIAAPANGATVTGANVMVKLDLSGDLKGYHPMKDPATGMGNHIHIILDNQPYEAYYDLAQPFELRNLAEGPHTLRVFASRPWHESYKNAAAFAMSSFTVKGGGTAGQPTTTADGQKMADAKKANANVAMTPKPTPEGKDMPASQGSIVDLKKPLLTYSRPKGEYKNADAEAIMIDFWLLNAKLAGDGGTYRVRYAVDGQEPKFIDKWGPIWLSGWTAGEHTVKLELTDQSGNVVENGAYNATTRKITIVR